MPQDREGVPEDEGWICADLAGLYGGAVGAVVCARRHLDELRDVEREGDHGHGNDVDQDTGGVAQGLEIHNTSIKLDRLVKLFFLVNYCSAKKHLKELKQSIKVLNKTHVDSRLVLMDRIYILRHLFSIYFSQNLPLLMTDWPETRALHTDCLSLFINSSSLLCQLLLFPATEAPSPTRLNLASRQSVFAFTVA